MEALDCIEKRIDNLNRILGTNPLDDKPDATLQAIVYKLVPGLYEKELLRILSSSLLHLLQAMGSLENALLRVQSPEGTKRVEIVEILPSELYESIHDASQMDIYNYAIYVDRIESTLCIFDLENDYAKWPVNVSSPIVQLRKAIVQQATVDMVNEAIVLRADEKKADNSVIAQIANQHCHIKILAFLLPKSVTDSLEANYELLKSATQFTYLSDRTRVRLKELQTSLLTAFKECTETPEVYHRDDVISRISNKYFAEFE